MTQQKPSKKFSALLDKCTNNPNAASDAMDNLSMCLFFIQHCNDKDQEKVKLHHILSAVKKIDIPTDAEIKSYDRFFNLESTQLSSLKYTVNVVRYYLNGTVKLSV